MAVRRKRKRPTYTGGEVGGSHYKRRMSGQSSVTVRTTVTGALSAGGGDLGAAANIIADRARELAVGWSAQIPPAIEVEVSGRTATISCQVGPAYPNEIEGVRHPVFGPTPERPEPPWVTNQHRPFFAPAADSASDAAMARYAQKIDKMARRAGFT